jgi:glycosyltransferase involved in cell wall biosynthesis
MDLSVIVAAHNEEALLPQQLDALVAQQWDGAWEVVVVDNRSTDGTADVVGRYSARHPNVRLVPATEGAGQSHAMNVGVASTTAPWLAFCDADDVVAPGWVAAIASGLQEHEVVTGPSELERLNPPWLVDVRGRSIEQPVGTFAGIFPCIRGADWGCRRETWEAIGGMNEEYQAGQDIDLSLRCWLAGVDIVGIPGALVHYRYRTSSAGLWRQGYAYGLHRPIIARRLRDLGLPRPPRLSGWKSWALLVVTLPAVVTRRGRARWIWVAANRSGQVVGSLRQRTIMV